jgi:hypothetical protein
MAFTGLASSMAKGAGSGSLLGPWGGVIGGALGGLVDLFGGSDQRQLQEQLTREQLDYQKKRDAQDLDQRRRELSLNATQLDPLKQQKSRQLNALVASLLQHSTPYDSTKAVSGAQWDPADFASFFTPGARENAENQFAVNAGTASGGAYRPPSGVGYPGATAPTPTTPVPGFIPPRGGREDMMARFQAFKNDPNRSISKFFSLKKSYPNA